MKKMIIAIAFLLTIAQLVNAQSPAYFNYRAAIKDAEGNPLTNQNINFQLSILEGTSSGASVFSQTTVVTSDQQGICNLKIGIGDNVVGYIDSIDWSNNSYYNIFNDTIGNKLYIISRINRYR